MPARVTITAPRDGARVKGTITVAGRAAPDTTVLLSAGCISSGCNAIARAGASGRWSAKLRASTKITASTASSGVLDRVRLRLAHAASSHHRAPIGEAEPSIVHRPRPTRVYVVGDSLAVGTEHLLPQLLPHDTITTNALTGRPLAAGMQIIRGLDLRSQPTVLAVSLFTNDDPRNVSTLEAAVRETVRDVGPDGCAVWATIVRPPYGGVSYRAANERLAELEAELEPRLILVPWAEQVASQPNLVGGDGVHGTPAGYQARAALYAQAIEQCGG